MKHAGKQPLFLYKLILRCKSFRSGGNTCQTFLIKDHGSWKGCSVLLSAQFFPPPWSNSDLPHTGCTTPLYFSQGQGMNTEEKLCRKNRPSNSELAADNFCGFLGEGLRQWDGISLGFAELPTKNAFSETPLRAFPVWGAKLFTCHKPDTVGPVGQCANGHYKAVRSDSGNSEVIPSPRGVQWTCIAPCFCKYHLKKG